MSRPRTTRGPLPAGVYWRRRVFVLGLLASIVLLTLNVLRGGEGDPPERATTSAATATETPAADRRERRRDRGSGTATGPSVEPAGPTAPDLAEPDGTCRPEDVVVTPVVDDAVAGEPVTITLRLRTLSSPACTWTLAARHVALKVTDGGEELWSSRECPGAVPRKDVVVRRQVVATATVTWNARRSEPGCPRDPRWVLPGTYDVYAATLGGEPVASSFDLAKPEPETVVVPVTPPKTSPTTSNRGRSGGR